MARRGQRADALVLGAHRDHHDAGPARRLECGVGEGLPELTAREAPAREEREQRGLGGAEDADRDRVALRRDAGEVRCLGARSGRRGRGGDARTSAGRRVGLGVRIVREAGVVEGPQDLGVAAQQPDHQDHEQRHHHRERDHERRHADQATGSTSPDPEPAAASRPSTEPELAEASRRGASRPGSSSSSERSGRGAGVERGPQVGDEIVDRLQAHRQPEERRIDLERRADGGRVRHPARVLDEGFDRAQRLGQREQLRGGGDLERGVLAAGGEEADHPAEGAHLARDAISCPGCDGRPG